MTEPVGLFGGTFDPIHYGHLRIAFELWQALRLSQVRLLPAGNPPHREAPLAGGELRLEMARLAIAGEPAFAVDDRELRRSGVSYSVDTLLDLRAEFGQRPLVLLLGMDAFLGMPTWHRWREIFDLAHVAVAHRPGWKAPMTGPLGEVMVDRGTGSVRDLHTAAAGRIYIHAGTQLEISSTDLRQLILSGRDLRYLVPETVRDLILRTGCYAQLSRP